MIQRKLPHPQSLEGALLHPQEVAVKSLIKASKSLFMVYTMSGGLPCFWKNKKFFSDRGFRRILCVYGGTALRDMLRYIEDSRWEKADNDILKQTQKIVEMASQDDKVGGKYMRTWEMMEREREEGLREDFKEDIVQKY